MIRGEWKINWSEQKKIKLNKNWKVLTRKLRDQGCHRITKGSLISSWRADYIVNELAKVRQQGEGIDRIGFTKAKALWEFGVDDHQGYRDRDSHSNPYICIMKMLIVSPRHSTSRRWTKKIPICREKVGGGAACKCLEISAFVRGIGTPVSSTGSICGLFGFWWDLITKGLAFGEPTFWSHISLSVGLILGKLDHVEGSSEVTWVYFWSE